MQSQDQYSETASLQLLLKSVTEKFDLAVKKDVPLVELKLLFHEMKELKTKLDALKHQNYNASNA
jgi:hypothetical protein